MSQWQATYQNRLTTPERAVESIQSGSTVNVPIFAPRSILDALWDRREKLQDVRVQLNAPTHNPGSRRTLGCRQEVIRVVRTQACRSAPRHRPRMAR